MSEFIDTSPQDHPCEKPGCELSVPYDDEPYCFKHSPDSGSFVKGYSWKRKHAGNYYCHFGLEQDNGAPGEHEWDSELEYCVHCELPYSEWSEPTMEQEPME